MGYSRKRYAYPRTKPGSLTTIVYVTKFPTANNVCAVALISHIFPSFLALFSTAFPCFSPPLSVFWWVQGEISRSTESQHGWTEQDLGGVRRSQRLRMDEF
jgi:hypothetical protein